MVKMRNKKIKKFTYRVLNKIFHGKLFGGQIYFENVSFYFSAPFSIFRHAKESGIEARITRLAMSFLHPGAVAIDVGANYGFITLAMGKCASPLGKVIAYEPVSHICQVLLGSINRSKLLGVCLVVPQPVGKQKINSFVTLDSEIERLGITRLDFIKIDVDGGDYDVLLGSKNTLERFHPPLVIEMHENKQLIVEFLKALGYIYMIGMNNEEFDGLNFPANLIASTQPIKIPPRGYFVNHA